MKLRMTLGAVAATAVLAAGPLAAQSVKWDMANEYPATSIHGEAQQVFTDKVAELSGGDMVITNHFGAALGYKSKDQFDAVADGALQIANTSMGQVAGIEPLFLLSSLPFLVGSAEEAQLLWEVAKPAYEEVFARNNQILLYASPWPPAGVWADKPIDSTDAIANVKVRAWDPSGTQTLKNAGAAAIQMSWADVVPQLASGGIEAVLTSAEGGVNAKFWEHVSHFSALNYSMSLNMTHVNRDEWEALSEDQQGMILEAAQVASDAAWGALATRVASNYADMQANGITVVDPVPADFLGVLNEAGQQVYDDWLGKVGDAGQTILDEYAAKKAAM